MKNNGVLKWGSLIGLLALLSGAIAAHFNGKAESKAYTDQKVERLNVKIDYLQQQVSTIGTDVAIIKSILEDRFGHPRKKEP